MTPADIVSVISSVGFPIVSCGAMGWFVYHTTEKHREEMTALNQQHYQEMLTVTEAINNNTVALTRLTENLGKEE